VLLSRPTIEELQTTIDHEADRSEEELAARVFEAALGTLDLFTIYIGDRLSYYELLASEEPLTSTELALRAGTEERYTREWLEQQAVSGFLTVAGTSDDAMTRKFTLPTQYTDVFTNRLSMSYLAPLARMLAAAGMKLPDIVDAHRSGGGVSWDAFGDDMRESQADMNRPSYMNLLAAEWFGGVPEIRRRLDSEARVADIGCGFGWSSIALATGYPSIVVDGYDLDEPSIAKARIHAAEGGVSDRVSFHAIDAGDPSVSGNYDIVTAFECIHDLPDPVSTLRTMRRIAADDGMVIVMDEKVSDTFHPDGDEIERLMYGFSNLICLPDGLAHADSVGTGTVMRPDVLRRYAQEAGFSHIEIMPIEAEMWRFYRLVV